MLAGMINNLFFMGPYNTCWHFTYLSNAPTHHNQVFPSFEVRISFKFLFLYTDFLLLPGDHPRQFFANM